MGFSSHLFNSSDKTGGAVVASQPPCEIALDAETAQAVLSELNIDTAIAAHENWSARLNAVIKGTSTEQLQPEVVSLDDRCDPGQWLHGPGPDRLGKYPAFSVLVARHKHFHVETATVLSLAQSGDQAKAEQKLGSGDRHTSNQVALLLKELKRGLGRR